MESAGEVLKPWENYYVILGSAAAALIGLVFVVITIISGDSTRPRSKEGTAIFTTPTVVHFAAALFVAFLLSVPWRSMAHPAIALFAVGIFGVVYLVRTMLRMNRMAGYSADLEDVVWHSCLPILAYAAIAIGASAIAYVAQTSMLAFAVASALLIFTGIHNAWDIVTFIAVPEDTAGDRRT